MSNFRNYFQVPKESQKYNSFGSKASALLDFDKNMVSNFNILEEHKMTNMMSKASGKDKLQVRFTHRSSKNKFFEESLEKNKRLG